MAYNDRSRIRQYLCLVTIWRLVLLALLFPAIIASVSTAGDNSQLFDDAGSGDREAQYTLAHLYLKGRGGLSRDPGKAIGWFCKAAEQGQRDAAFDLAVLYVEGTAIEKDRIKALKWFEKAADSDHTEAQFILGLTYQKTDIEKAVGWLKKAALQGHQRAAAKLQEVCGHVLDFCADIKF